MNVREIELKDAELSRVSWEVSCDIGRACRMEKITGRKFVGVYTIGNVLGRPVKIGVASNPRSRLRELQTGNATRLVIHSVLWVEGMSEAYAVEREAHRLCEERYPRMMGEWFLCNDNHAAEIVELACISCETTYYRRLLAVEGFDDPWLPKRVTTENEYV